MRGWQAAYIDFESIYRPKSDNRGVFNLCKGVTVFSHVFVSVTDFERALRFYNAVMDALQTAQRFCDPAKPWAGWHSADGSWLFFVICTPHNCAVHDPGNGQMVAFEAGSREVVRKAHHAALNHGGTCEGRPGLRLQYHPHYFGVYFGDPDGNKFCVACHVPTQEVLDECVL